MAGCLQTVFCVFNAIIAILAAGCVGVGSWALADKDGFLSEFNKMIEELKTDAFSAADIQGAAILIVIIGSVILLVAGIGCCGAWKESKCLLGVFFISMILVCALVVAVVIIFYVYPGKLRTGFKTVFDEYIKNGDKASQDVVNSVEKTFKCCGVNGIADYTPERPAPAHCTKQSTGCADKLRDAISKIQSPVTIVAIITLVLLALATAISGYLYCTVDGRAV